MSVKATVAHEPSPPPDEEEEEAINLTDWTRPNRVKCSVTLSAVIFSGRFFTKRCLLCRIVVSQRDWLV